MSQNIMKLIPVYFYILWTTKIYNTLKSHKKHTHMDFLQIYLFLD